MKKILVTQPRPDSEKSPYFDLAQKFNLDIIFRPFVEIVGLTPQEFRRARISLQVYKSVIFTSKNVVDHFFQLCRGMRVNMPESMKYFCLSETIALYLQKYIQYRKRKIFFGKQEFSDLLDILLKHRDDPVLYPCSDLHKQDIPQQLQLNGVNYTKAVIYKSMCCDLSDLVHEKYDMIVFFSPSSIRSLLENFPDFRQNNTLFAAFGPSTAKAVADAGFRLDLQAPSPTAPSMTMAIDQYLKKKVKKAVN
ncbi:MAG: uroporphyrinogen-III synthase [Bacteroidetes bacterium]|nr:uroporphyrinogen-III synthase [Bacteroidota bacterium]